MTRLEDELIRKINVRYKIDCKDLTPKRVVGIVLSKAKITRDYENAFYLVERFGIKDCIVYNNYLKSVCKK